MATEILLDPAIAPPGGMVSSRDPSALSADEYAVLDNFVISDGYAMARYGDVQVNVGVSGLPTGKTIIGAIVHAGTGVVVVVIAENSTDASIYYYNPLIASPTWTVLVPSAGPRADNVPMVFVDVKTCNAQWSPAKSTMLVAQVFSNKSIGPINIFLDKDTGVMTAPNATSAQISASDPAQSFSVLVPNFNWFVRALTGGQIYNSGGGIVSSRVSPTGQGQHMLLTIAAATAIGASAGFEGVTARPVYLQKQMQVFFKCDDPYIWDKVKVQIKTTAGAWVDVYDPVSSTFNAGPVIVDAGNGYAVVGFTIAGTALTATTYEGFRVMWNGPDVAPATLLRIYLVSFGGAFQGGGQFGTNTYNSQTLDESPGTVMQAKVSSLYDMGGTQIPGQTFPESPLLYMDAKVYYPSTGGGIYHYHIFYHKPDGAESFNALETRTQDTGAVQMSTSLTANLLYSKTMPDAYHVSAVHASVMVALNGRLVLGDCDYAGGNNHQEMMISGTENPLRFRQIPKVQDGAIIEYEGTVAAFNGEKIKAFAVASGSILGADSLVIATDRSVWTADGGASTLGQPRRVSPYGTSSPASVTAFGNTVFWLDSNANARLLPGDSISNQTVNDILSGIPTAYLKNVTATIYDDKIYVGYTPSGGTTNTKALIFDLRSGKWTRQTALFGEFWRFMSASMLGYRRNYYFRTSGLCYEYERSGTISNVPVSIRTRQVRATPAKDGKGIEERVNCKKVGVTCDKVSGATLTVSLITGRSNLTAPTGTVDLSGASNISLVREWARQASGIDLGGEDYGIQVDVSGTVPSGTKLKQIFVEIGNSGMDVGAPIPN